MIYPVFFGLTQIKNLKLAHPVVKIGVGVALGLGVGMFLVACQRSAVPTAETRSFRSASSTQPSTPVTTAQNLSHQIATAMFSTDAMQVVHELVMPTKVPLTLTDYQKAYLDSIAIMHHAMMTGMQPTTADHDNRPNPDAMFANNMLAHHRGAIEMAKIELNYGKDNTLKALAQDIILAQQNEAQLMQNFLAEAHPSPSQKGSQPVPNQAQLQQEFNNGMDDMNEQMLAGIMSQNPDIAFVQAMLPHHKGALAMAQVELKYGTDKKMRQLADSIIETQQNEIKFMQDWLKEAKPL